MSAQAQPALPPYLSLSVGQVASSLAAPNEPEPQKHATIPALLQHRARHSPAQLAVGFPDCDGQQPCLSWTYSQLWHGAAHVAAQLRARLSERVAASGRKQPVVALLGPSGPAFLLHVVACWQLGAAILPIAIGTTADGAANLCRLAECCLVLADRSQSELAGRVEAQLQSDGLCASWLDHCSPESTDVEGPAPEPVHSCSGDDLLVIFHSSGSSGNPKPISQLHRFWTSSLTTAPGADKAAFTTTPLFHGGLSDLLRAFQAAAPIFFFGWHQQRAPSAGNIGLSVRSCGQPIAYFLSVPFILEMLSKDEKGSSLLREMDLVSTGGAPLPESVGDSMVERGMHLVSRLGSSECGFLMSSWRDFKTDKAWSWLRVTDPRSKKWLLFQPQGEGDPLHELIVSSDWPAKIVSNREDGAFATGDLYERGPDQPDHWRYARRSDDSIVLVNGKKAAPAPIETALAASSLVANAVVFGSNRPMLGAVVQPAEAHRDEPEAEFRRKLEAELDSINLSQPSHARIAGELIHIGDADLFANLPRSSKGTLQRGLAMEQLADVINEVYARFDRGDPLTDEPVVQREGAELRSWLRSYLKKLVGKEVEDHTDFYGSGLDSLMAARFRSALIRQGAAKSKLRLDANVIYDCGTVERLAQFIEGSDTAAKSEPAALADEFVRRYVQPLQEHRSTAQARSTSGAATVLLTGSTGALGSRILGALLRKPAAEVAAVYCLVRAPDAESAKKRIGLALRQRKCGLEGSDVETRIVALSSLDDATVAELRKAERLVVIHSAWIVNFALSLASFETECIKPLQELLQIFQSASHPSRFVFCSSIASVGVAPSPVKEEASTNFAHAGATGYGQSKWVAERLCQAAGDRVTVARVGQLCGDTEHGIWNETEAWPLLVRTADEVGCLPSSGPDIDWLPVDTAAAALIDLAFSPSIQLEHVHVVSPPHKHRPAWADLLGWLQAAGVNFDTKPNDEWLAALRKAGAQIRGRALVDSIWAHLSEPAEEREVLTQKAEGASESLSQAAPVDAELIRKTVAAWRASSFLRRDRALCA